MYIYDKIIHCVMPFSDHFSKSHDRKWTAKRALGAPKNDFLIIFDEKKKLCKGKNMIFQF